MQKRRRVLAVIGHYFPCLHHKDKDLPFLHHFGDRDMVGGYRLHGWIDLGHPSIVFAGGAAYDKNGSEADYLEMKTRLKNVDTAVKASLQEHWAEEDAAARQRLTNPPGGITGEL